ncbi:MAG TPA: undecaprenyl-diphosphate phosphatase [Synergistales bacterium]|jgi:undecaprenyl-diphosphatase|nr:undecaprenyl-diphosphate phosphatase [Synergistales bacterium]HRV70405.1 undecaprenyl-diphosphate phosphatase [Thermovirgaceae bacterium]
MLISQCALLGLLQGFTEFLPVSSSGHLVIAQSLFGWQDPAIAFDVMLHLATMAATLVFFRKEIFYLALGWFGGLVSRAGRDHPGWRYGWSVLAGSVATVAIVLVTRPVIHVFFGNTLFVGLALVFTGAVLWYGNGISVKDGEVSVPTGLMVGLAQGLAAFPGLSRSGLTIIAGLKSGLGREEAFSFSFLLSLPAILGAAILELPDAGGISGVSGSLPQGWWIGVLLAFLSGLFALSLLRKVVVRGKWKVFAVYCLIAGAFVLAVNIFGR